jgi:hypothetical protein
LQKPLKIPYLVGFSPASGEISHQMLVRILPNKEFLEFLENLEVADPFHPAHMPFGLHCGKDRQGLVADPFRRAHKPHMERTGRAWIPGSVST